MSRTFVSRLSANKAYICAECTARSTLRQSRRYGSQPSPAPRRGVLKLLEQRGFVNRIAGDRNALETLLDTRRVGFYAGIDPTAPSLHLGHLLPLMVLFWLYHHGHHTVSLIGGATARVGDPSGRLTSRAQTAEAVTEANVRAMHAQVGQLWRNAVRYGARHAQDREGVGKKELLNNADWLDGLNVLQFLRLMGNGMRLGTMLGRDTVRNKMEKGDGMSFSEFSYPLLQAWDWWQMHQDRGVQIQIGGSDQYGNIIAGIDAVKYIVQQSQQSQTDERLREEKSPMGLTVPLLTTSSGEKFGKSAGNAVWLDRNLTSSFDLYGFLLRTTDDDVERYLNLFTFVPDDHIAAIMSEHKADPGKRKAQHLLASEVLELVHGPEEATRTREEHQAMRRPTVASLMNQDGGVVDAPQAATAAQHTTLPKSLVLDAPFSRILYHAGLVASKSEGARAISKGGAYVAVATTSTQGTGSELKFVPIKDQRPVDITSLSSDGILILRLGKWKVRVVKVVDDREFEVSGLEVPGWAEYNDNVRR